MEHIDERHAAARPGRPRRSRGGVIWPHALGLGTLLALGLCIVRRSEGAFAELGLPALQLVTYGFLAGLLCWAAARVLLPRLRVHPGVARASQPRPRPRQTSGSEDEQQERPRTARRMPTQPDIVAGAAAAVLATAGFLLLLGMAGTSTASALPSPDSAPSPLCGMAGLLVGVSIGLLAEAWVDRLACLRPSELIRAAGIALLVVGLDQAAFTSIRGTSAGCALGILTALACAGALLAVPAAGRGRGDAPEPRDSQDPATQAKGMPAAGDGPASLAGTPHAGNAYPAEASTGSDTQGHGSQPAVGPILVWQPTERERRELLSSLTDSADRLLQKAATGKVRLHDVGTATWISLAVLAFCGFITGLTWDPVASEETSWRPAALAIDAIGLLVGTAACACIVLLGRRRQPEAARLELLVRVMQPVALAIVLVVPIVKLWVEPTFALSLGITALSIAGFAMSTCVAFIEVTLVVRLTGMPWERALPPLVALLGISLGVGMVSIDSLGSNGRVLCFVLEAILFTAVAISYALRPRATAGSGQEGTVSGQASLSGADMSTPATRGVTDGAGASARPDDASGELALRRRCQVVAERHNLSPRETEVLPYLGRGYGSAYTAATLGISENTVRTHVRHIYEKLGVSSREELIAYVDGVGSARDPEASRGE